MKAEFVITTDGQLRLITQEGSFEQGSTKLRLLIAQLAASGLNISLEGEIEQHRHDQTHTQLNTQNA